MGLRRNVFFRCAILGVALVALAGCWDLLSWSPDGRYLAFVSTDDHELWLWDTQLNKPQRLHEGEVVHANYLSPTDRILYLKEDDDTSSNDGLRAAIHDTATGGSRDLSFGTNPWGYCVGPEGKLVYAIHEIDDGNAYELREHSLDHPETDRLLHTSSSEIYHPAIDDGGRQILFVTEDDNYELLLLDIATDPPSLRTLIANSNRVMTAPAWIGSNAFTYYRTRDTENDVFENLSELVLYDLDRRSEVVLHDLAMGILRPKRTHDGRRLVFMGCPAERSEDYELEWYSKFQLLSVDLNTRQVNVLTDETFGAGYTAVNPQRNSIAYLSPPDLDAEEASVRILDLDTGKTTVLWRNEEERMFAYAERFFENGDTALASEAYRDLLQRFPDTRYHDPAWFRQLQLQLGDPYYDVDAAVDALSRIRSYKIVQPSRPLIWRPQDKIATDRVNDLLASFDESIPVEDRLDPNRTLDLTTLHARWSRDRLLLLIGFESDYALPALQFKDILLLFDHDFIDDGVMELASDLAWDRPASRQVWIRKWQEGGSDSKYNIEIRDAQNKMISEYKASGFPEGDYPHVRIIGNFYLVADEGAIALSLSRNILRLENDSECHLQVAILISPEDRRAAFPELDHKSVGLSLADAFGEGNAPSRPATVGPTTIKGSAAVLKPPPERR